MGSNGSKGSKGSDKSGNPRGRSGSPARQRPKAQAKAKTKALAAPGPNIMWCEANLNGRCTYEEKTGKKCPRAHATMEVKQDMVRAQRALSAARKAAAKANPE